MRVCFTGLSNHYFGFSSDFLSCYLFLKYCTTSIIEVLLEVLKSGSVLLMLQYCVNFFLFLFETGSRVSQVGLKLSLS